MSAILEFRTAVSNALKGASIDTYPFLPGVIRPPAAVLLHGDPYVEPGDVFGEVRVNLVVLLAVTSGDNETATNDLDVLLMAAIEALAPDYGPLNVNEPAILQNQEQNLLTARLTVTEYFTLERGN